MVFDSTIIFLPFVLFGSEGKTPFFFQFRLIHRVLGTNGLLFLMNLIDSPLCSICQKEGGTLDEIYSHGNVILIRLVLLDVEETGFFLKRQFIFSKEDIFFCFNRLRNHQFNFLIFHLNYYIFQM